MIFIYPIYNHNWRNISTIYIYKTILASNEIFSPSNKIHREVGRAKDLSAPLYCVLTQNTPITVFTIVEIFLFTSILTTSTASPSRGCWIVCSWNVVVYHAGTSSRQLPTTWRHIPVDPSTPFVATYRFVLHNVQAGCRQGSPYFTTHLSSLAVVSCG
jgi:hypothetical protein